ncbi:MAG: hypothetical protein ACJ790_16330 [Myxococcaceae bacterium]
MTGKLLLGAACALAILSCEPTTYGQAVQQQKRAEAVPAATNDRAAEPGADAPLCPTPAARGSRDYGYCEQELTNSSVMNDESGTGGSGDLRCRLPR